MGQALIDIGIASYQNPDKLFAVIQAIQARTDGEWRLLIVDNASPDPKVREVITTAAAGDPRIIPEFRTDNIGYVGAVNRILEWAESDYVAYCDNDAIIGTQGWDRIMSEVLAAHHEVVMAFPKQYCAYPIERPGYSEVLWGLGCFWMLKSVNARQPPTDIGPWDTSLGHQEEVDYTMRLRLQGWKIAGVNVVVDHEAKASSDPAAQERISNGVINWMNKWCAYFCGVGVTYHSANVLRFEDWPLNALHIEAWLQAAQLRGEFPILNQNPDQASYGGKTFDLIKVPKWPNLYRDRLV